MSNQEEQIGSYRLRQDENSVVIDEVKGFFTATFDLMFGLGFMFPLVLFTTLYLKSGFIVDSDSFSAHHPFWGWLIVIPFLCVPFLFAYLGIHIAFARNCIEIKNDKILQGDKWFGLWPWLKTRLVSEICSIKLDWQRTSGIFGGGRWVCVVSILSSNKVKSIRLLSCSKKDAALKLAKSISEKTRLPVEDATNS